ncbi:MAG: hypothetical protein R6T90_09135 [Dissulfuribacterales bacterium]
MLIPSAKTPSAQPDQTGVHIASVWSGKITNRLIIYVRRQNPIREMARMQDKPKVINQIYLGLGKARPEPKISPIPDAGTCGYKWSTYLVRTESACFRVEKKS